MIVDMEWLLPNKKKKSHIQYRLYTYKDVIIILSEMKIANYVWSFFVF